MRGGPLARANKLRPLNKSYYTLKKRDRDFSTNSNDNDNDDDDNNNNNNNNNKDELRVGRLITAWGQNRKSFSLCREREREI